MAYSTGIQKVIDRAVALGFPPEFVKFMSKDSWFDELPLCSQEELLTEFTLKVAKRLGISYLYLSGLESSTKTEVKWSSSLHYLTDCLYHEIDPSVFPVIFKFYIPCLPKITTVHQNRGVEFSVIYTHGKKENNKIVKDFIDWGSMKTSTKDFLERFFS